MIYHYEKKKKVSQQTYRIHTTLNTGNLIVLFVVEQTVNRWETKSSLNISNRVAKAYNMSSVSVSV